MEWNTERENFLKVSYIILDIIPKQLQKLFIEKWNEKYPDQIWSSDASSGSHMYDKLSDGFKDNKMKKMFVDQFKKGNEQEWDTTTLVQAMLHSGLDLVPPCRNKHKRTYPLRISEEIDIIRGIRNELFAHLTSTSYTSGEFSEILEDIKCVAKNLFGKDIETEIYKVQTSPVKVLEYKTSDAIIQKLDELLMTKESRKKDFEKFLEGWNGKS